MATILAPTGHVANQAALSGISTPQNGDIYIAGDTGRAWEYNATTSTWNELPQGQAAPPPGTAVVGTTTIDALFTTMFATRSGDLGTATYAWATPTSIIGTFPAGTTPTAQNATAMFVRFEARPNQPSVLAP